MGNNEKIEILFTELVSFIRKQSGEDKMPITRETSIEDDLGITGDDAYDLIIAFGKKYNIDVSGFIFTKYFNDEPSMFDTTRKVEPFTIGHLEKAMIARRLDEEIMNG